MMHWHCFKIPYPCAPESKPLSSPPPPPPSPLPKHKNLHFQRVYVHDDGVDNWARGKVACTKFSSRHVLYANSYVFFRALSPTDASPGWEANNRERERESCVMVYNEPPLPLGASLVRLFTYERVLHISRASPLAPCTSPPVHTRPFKRLFREYPRARLYHLHFLGARTLSLSFTPVVV